MENLEMWTFLLESFPAQIQPAYFSTRGNQRYQHRKEDTLSRGFGLIPTLCLLELKKNKFEIRPTTTREN